MSFNILLTIFTLLIVQLVEATSVAVPIDSESIDAYGKPYVSSLTVEKSAFAFILLSGVIAGILLGLAFHYAWERNIRDKRGGRQLGSSRESLIRVQEYRSAKNQGGCIIS